MFGVAWTAKSAIPGTRLLNEHPKVFRRVPPEYVASYLGNTAETLDLYLVRADLLAISTRLDTKPNVLVGLSQRALISPSIF